MNLALLTWYNRIFAQIGGQQQRGTLGSNTASWQCREEEGEESEKYRQRVCLQSSVLGVFLALLPFDKWSSCTGCAKGADVHHCFGEG